MRVSFGKVAAQSILPRRHAELVLMQAFRREYGIGGSFRRPSNSVTRGRAYNCLQPCGAYDLTSKLEPRAVAGVGGVNNSFSSATTQLNHSAGQVAIIRGASALIVDNLDLWTACGQLQYRIRKAFASYPEQP